MVSRMLLRSTSDVGKGLVLALAVNLYARLEDPVAATDVPACVHIASIVNLPDGFHNDLFLEKPNDPILAAVQRVLNELKFKILNATCATLLVRREGHTSICLTTLAGVLESHAGAEEGCQEYLAQLRGKRRRRT